MGCSCNSNFSNFSKEIKEKFDVERYEKALLSDDMRTVSNIMDSINIRKKRSNPKADELEILEDYLERARARYKVLGLTRRLSMTRGAISTNKGNPNFPLAEYEKKEKDDVQMIETAIKEYNRVSGIEDEVDETVSDISFFKKNKTMLIVLGFGVLSFVGFKLYKKYN